MATLPQREQDLSDEFAALSLQTDRDRRQALAALEVRDELKEQAVALLDRLKRLDDLEEHFSQVLEREKLDSLRELAYGASHEINNPLANVSSRAQTLLRDETDPARRKKLESINRQAFRAHEMIANMMLFAKPPDMVLGEVDLCELIEQVASELSEDASAQGTALVTRGLADPCILSADGTHLAVAIKSLCENSLQAVATGGQITVSIAKSESDFAIRVSDSGPGVPPEVRAHIFDPFYSGREAGRGLGFGLSKCWRIVDLHGGSIQVESPEGMGATFTIRLPRESIIEKSSATMLAHG